MKMFKKVITNFILLIFIFYYVAGFALANPMPISYDPRPDFLLGFLLLFIINFPINSIFYIGLLYLILSKKEKEETFKEFPTTFIERVLLIVSLATLFGALIDSLIISSFFKLSIFGLIFIFLSYFFLIIYFQKLKVLDAIKIGVAMFIINGLTWLMILFITSPINSPLVLPLFYIICVIGFIISFYRVWLWYKNNYFLVRKDKGKQIQLELSNKSESILASIINAQTILKEISIFFTNKQIIITKKGLTGKLDEILKSNEIIFKVPYDDIIYLHFKLKFLNNDLVIKTNNRTEEYYCNREELIIAKHSLEKYLSELIVT